MNRVLYFAYGSNILADRLSKRVGITNYVKNYTLFGYTLAFNGGFGAYANIVQTNNPEDKVEGCLYHLNDRQISMLDGFEGYPTSYQKFHFVDNEDIIFGYWTDRETRHQLRDKPYLEYLNLIIDGCIERGLHYTFQKLVDFKGQNYVLRKGNKYKNVNVGEVRVKGRKRKLLK